MIKEKQIISDSLDEYYASHRSPAIVNHNGNDREIGRVFTEYNEKLIIIDGDDKKEHEYLIPKAKVNNYDERKVYLNISEDFERAWDLVNCPEKFIMLVNCPEKFIIIEI